jgi:hypothetical protein
VAWGGYVPNSPGEADVRPPKAGAAGERFTWECRACSRQTFGGKRGGLATPPNKLLPRPLFTAIRLATGNSNKVPT